MSLKSVFITGTAADIGRAIGKLFAANGYFVGLFDVDETGLKALARELGEHHTYSGRLDVAAPEEWPRALVAYMHRVIDINVKGVLNGCYLALPDLRKTPGALLLCQADGYYPNGISGVDASRRQL